MNANYTKNTILWADDDADDIYLVKQVLEETDHDYNIVIVSNGREVIDYLSRLTKEEFPCLIILDINMPVLDGKQTLATLKKHPDFKSIAVAMFSTSNSPTDKLFCSHYDADLVTKPSNYEALKNAVANLLKQCVTTEK
jgi:CheY-like chemotaxis protein